jgi:hypothetical protein
MNVFLRKFKEYNISPNIGIGGYWNIAIVNKNGQEKFPFGHHMKKNMILDQGLDILASNKYYTSYGGLNWNATSAFLLGDAVLGGSSIPVSPSDVSLNNELQSTNIINDDSCTINDDYINGSRTFRKVYDFQTPQSPIAVREFGIRTRFNAVNNQNKMFSRFVLPENISIGTQEFVRLFYDFTIKCDAIVNPINVTRSSGTLNCNGVLKLCGRFDDIFGAYDANGNPIIRYGDSPQSTFMPYCEEFCVQENCLHKCIGTAYLIADIFIPTSPGSSIIGEWVGSKPTEDENTVIASSYINGNFYRDITYIFERGNPFENKPFQGFLFSTAKSDRENTVAGWFWEFNNKQIKLIEKEIVIQIRQSMSRIDTPDTMSYAP